MAQPTDSDGRSADPDFEADRFSIHPAYNSDDDEKAPHVWGLSDRLRDVIRSKGRSEPEKDYRGLLATAITRQVRTVVLYWQVQAAQKNSSLTEALLKLLATALEATLVPVARQGASKNNRPVDTLKVFTILFPGEARDNTGIKDLNDKVLGYSIANEYMKFRQFEIGNIFHTNGFMVAGQDYKTATILTVDGNRSEFIKRLATLDVALRKHLLDTILPKAEKDARKQRDQDRLKEIQRLRRTLTKKRNYAFDIYFGMSELKVRGQSWQPIDGAFLLYTESLKAAAVSRFAAKGKTLKTKPVKPIGRAIKPDRKKLDPRGKQFVYSVFMRALSSAGKIKDTMTKPPSDKSGFYEYLHVLIDNVWTVAFLRIRYRRNWIYFGNPDVIRDVRKKKLVRPKLKRGVKFSFAAQKEFLELWLVALNGLDLIKDFTLADYPARLVKQNEDALEMFRDTGLTQSTIDWQKMERVLTTDVRGRKIAVLGTASEYQFYSGAADHETRIFFSMDIRDLGVDAVLLLEYFGEQIEDDKARGKALMRRTFEASDALVERKRFTYDSVERVFRKYYNQISRSRTASVLAEASKAFGGKVSVNSVMPGFEASVQMLLGGDEVFVAAHPFFADAVSDIIRDLDATQYKGDSLNMRYVVTYSVANNTFGNKQREANRIAHHKAMKLADVAPSRLKAMERKHRRMERLIDMLETNEKKRHLAPDFREALEKLGLTSLFGRGLHGQVAPLTRRRYRRFIEWLDQEEIDAGDAPEPFEWVRFDGTLVDIKKLVAAAERLEQKIDTKVGRDNTHVDPPPAKKIPKVLDDYLNPDKGKNK